MSGSFVPRYNCSWQEGELVSVYFWFQCGELPGVPVVGVSQGDWEWGLLHTLQLFCIACQSWHEPSWSGGTSTSNHVVPCRLLSYGLYHFYIAMYFYLCISAGMGP